MLATLSADIDNATAEFRLTATLDGQAIDPELFARLVALADDGLDSRVKVTGTLSIEGDVLRELPRSDQLD